MPLTLLCIKLLQLSQKSDSQFRGFDRELLRRELPQNAAGVGAHGEKAFRAPSIARATLIPN